MGLCRLLALLQEQKALQQTDVLAFTQLPALHARAAVQASYDASIHPSIHPSIRVLLAAEIQIR
jgi:hypothetical protein